MEKQLARLDKIVRLGTSNTRGNRSFNTFARITFDGERLSITGVEGPLKGGNCLGSCGQIVDTFAVTTCAPGWSFGLLARFRETWRRWHLNDMRAGCEHQEQKRRDLKIAVEVGELCTLCNYQYGHAWKFEAVPADVITFLESLPDTDVKPAWI